MTGPAGAAGLLGAALAVVLGLSGCATATPSAASLAGTWRDDRGATRLVLHADGTCTAGLLGTTEGVANGRGTWRVGVAGDPDLRQDGRPVVELDFRADPASVVGGTRFEVDGSGSTATLLQDDPATDSQTTLHR